MLFHGTIFFTGFYFHPESSGFWHQLPLLQVLAFIPPLLLTFYTFYRRVNYKINGEMSIMSNDGCVYACLNEEPKFEKLPFSIDGVCIVLRYNNIVQR